MQFAKYHLALALATLFWILSVPWLVTFDNKTYIALPESLPLQPCAQCLTAQIIVIIILYSEVRNTSMGGEMIYRTGHGIAKGSSSLY